MALGKRFFRVIWFSLVRIITSPLVIIFHSPIIDMVWLCHLTGYLNKTSKILCHIKVLTSSLTLWFRVAILSPFNINTLAGKGLLISVLGWRFSQRLCWSSRFKIILSFFVLWQRLQFGLQFCMGTRVKDVFLSSGLQCGHPFCIKIVDKSALILFLAGYYTFITLFCMNNLLGNYFTFFLFLVEGVRFAAC